jgi:hypothetical protein
MAVAKKGRRKVVVDERAFWWSIDDDRELMYWKNPDGTLGLVFMLLTIVSEDKRFMVKYALGQWQAPPQYPTHLVVIGPEFGGLSPSHGGWTYVATPRWDDDAPSGRLVRTIVTWGLAEHEPRRLVDDEKAHYLTRAK